MATQQPTSTNLFITFSHKAGEWVFFNLFGPAEEIEAYCQSLPLDSSGQRLKPAINQVTGQIMYVTSCSPVTKDGTPAPAGAIAPLIKTGRIRMFQRTIAGVVRTSYVHDVEEYLTYKNLASTEPGLASFWMERALATLNTTTVPREFLENPPIYGGVKQAPVVAPPVTNQVPEGEVEFAPPQVAPDKE